jgi:hypothetical protein
LKLEGGDFSGDREKISVREVQKFGSAGIVYVDRFVLLRMKKEYFSKRRIEIEIKSILNGKEEIF